MAVVCIESARIPAPGAGRSGYIVLRGNTYPDDHPAVGHCPHLFVAPDVWAREVVVEQATAAPGETRRVRRG
jgi:hypothetical protein